MKLFALAFFDTLTSMEKLRMRPRMAVLWWACLGLCACGKFNRIENGGFTEVKFARSFMSYGDSIDSMVLDGGVMIYAYSSSYVTNLKLSSESAAPGASLTLPNGEYSFYAVGYTDAAYPLRSSTRCAIVGSGTPVTLDGTSRTITLNMDRSTCADGAFVNNSSFTHGGTNATEMYEFGRLQMVYCGTGAATAISSFGTSQTCGWAATSPDYRWLTGTSPTFVGDMSYQVHIPIFKRSSGAYQKLAGGLSGACQYVSTAGEQVSSATELSRVPLGSTSRAGLFPVEIASYDSTDCTGTPNMHYFNDGLIFGPSSGSSNTGSKLISISTTVGTTVKSALYFLIGT